MKKFTNLKLKLISFSSVRVLPEILSLNLNYLKIEIHLTVVFFVSKFKHKIGFFKRNEKPVVFL